MTATDEHRQRIERAIAFVIARASEPIRVADVAKAAHFSEFHFQRIFAATMGESVGEFIIRTRLETAALRLAYQPSRSVTDIASASGYTSVANFSKAFAAYFGCAPSAVRRPQVREDGRIGKLTRRYGKDFDPRALYALPRAPDAAERRRRKDEVARDMRFEERDDTPLVCLASKEGYDLTALDALWAELIGRVRALGLAGEAIDAYGIAHDSPVLTAPERCRYHAGIPVPRATSCDPPLFTAVIPRGRYAIFRHRGTVADVATTYRDVYSVWFPESGVEPDDFHPFEHYVTDAPIDGVVDMEIGFKVRPRR